MTIRSRAARAVAALPPSWRWRTRRAVALLRWVRLSASAARTPSDAYDDEFWGRHEANEWTGLAALVLRYCAPRSLVDVGCGDGGLLAAIRALDPDVEILGVDGSRAALSRARRRGIPVEEWDLMFWRPRNAKPLGARLAGFDVVVSLETAEHLPPWSGRSLIRILTQGRMVVFSAAHPGQGGTLHMNERTFEYWRARFAEHGFHPSRFDAPFRDAVRAMDLPWWYAANLHVFERPAP
jgi:SAM-dependent methyltransferase